MSAPHFQSGDYTILHGDCIEVMRELPAASVHAIVTDPPYGLGFMGKEWDTPGSFVERKAAKRNSFDHVGGNHNPSNSADAARTRRSESQKFGAWCEEWAVEALRVLKPGGHLLAFGGTRTWHRLAVAIEDAGFEMRDSIAWLYGSGFPKSMNVAKAIASGGGRPEDIRRMQMGADYTPSGRGRVNYDHGGGSAMNGKTDVDVNLSDAARQWEGWGTALKPAFEPIVVARKPLDGTVAANVLTHGTGALNIDGTRISTTDTLTGSGSAPLKHGGMNARPFHETAEPRGVQQHEAGRFPANVLLDESQAAELDVQSGVLTSGLMPPGTPKQGKAAGILGAFAPQESTSVTYGDSGGASRFFPTFRYEAKAPTSERPVVDGVAHPTVKPLELMRWLVRLVTPPGGTVLEPFAGSGTTVEACIREGFACIAIEREATYLPLIMARIQKDQQQSLLGDWDGAV